MDLTLLIRGQSNAQLFSQFHGPALVAERAQTLLGFDGTHDRIVVRGGPGVTEFGGTALQRGSDKMPPAWIEGGPPSWQPGRYEATLLAALRALPPEVRRAPTLTLWMHNESDSSDPWMTTARWVSAVRQDAAWVRQILGQSPATTPYLFVWVPFDFDRSPRNTRFVDDGSQRIRAGMASLAADPGFNARLGPQTGDLDMDFGGAGPGGLHMSAADAQSLVDRLGRAVADAFAAYAKPGSPEARARQADSPRAVSARVADRAGGLVRVTLLSPDPLKPLSPAALRGAGWVVRGADGTVRVPSSVRAEGNGLVLAFGGPLPEPATLYYGYGHGRIDLADGPGRGAAIEDQRGLGLTSPYAGLPLTGG